MPDLFRRILVPFDVSMRSTKAAEYAALLASRVGASIRLLHIYDPPDSMTGIVPGTSRSEENRSARDLAERELSRVRDLITAEGTVQVDTAIVPGSPVDEILRQAAEGNFDLIVMGTHGRSGLQRILLGSVTEQVLRHAKVPVLVIHLPDLPR